MNVDSPPVIPVIGATPMLMPFSSIRPSQTEGPGAMPMFPLCSAASHVGPASSFEPGAATPSSYNVRYTPKTSAISFESIVLVVPSALITSPPLAQTEATW
jgi:hypothetical protein